MADGDGFRWTQVYADTAKRTRSNVNEPRFLFAVNLENALRADADADKRNTSRTLGVVDGNLRFMLVHGESTIK